MMERLLLIDDSEADRLLLRLNLPDFDVDGAESLEEGLRKLGEGVYDAVILDLMLPGVEGFDGITRLKEVDARVPVIVYSGLYHDESVAQAKAAGAADYLKKDIDAGESIAGQILRVIERGRREGKPKAKARRHLLK